ncbi:MAG: HD domain-containing protein [Fervidicoccaceae archaeon]
MPDKALSNKARTIFKDPVHNIIPVNDYEYAILQHPILNRLHGIKQLGFTFFVYPQAKHSRFEHSIGVMHVAGKMADAIEVNTPEKISALLRSRCSFQDFKQIVRLSGLLHDIGHLPYSHITELVLMEEVSSGRTSEELVKVVDEATRKGLKLHEYYSCLFAKKLANEIKKEWENGKKLSKYLASASHVLCKEEMGDSVLSPLGVGVVRRLISGDILDADRIDYLARDAYNTGSTYGIIDIERIISGLGLTSYDKELVLSIPSKLLSSIEELYYARYMMYKWVYFHHKVISIDLTYRSLLVGISKDWEKIRRKIARLFPGMPSNFWNLFLPSAIWNSSVKYGYKIDDSFIDLILKVVASSDIPSLSLLSKGIINRRIPLYSVIKREEDIATMLSSIADISELKINPASLLDTLGSAFALIANQKQTICDMMLKRLKIVESSCCSTPSALPNEILSCIAREYINSKLKEKSPNPPSIVSYISLPISGGADSTKLLLISDKNAFPVMNSSTILQEIQRLGSRPLLYLYATKRPNESEKEEIKNAIASFLIELKKAIDVPEEGKNDEVLHRNSGVRTKQRRQ